MKQRAGNLFMEILIDPDAGFCPGVRHAVRILQERFAADRDLVCLGPLIHNRRELDRLADHGLETVEQAAIDDRDRSLGMQDKTLFLRTHGVGESVYHKLEDLNVKYIDATCGIVKSVQKLAKSYATKGYQVIIIGKKGHPEVEGLLGHCQGRGRVVSQEEDLKLIDDKAKTLIIAQTTIGKDKFAKWSGALGERIRSVTVKDTTCRYIGKRQDDIRAFASSVDVLIFVGGKESSNSQVLFELCKRENRKSYKIEYPEEIDAGWFAKSRRVGVTGGASTPVWQLTEVRDYILELSA